MENKNILTLKEAATFMGISSSTLYKMTHRRTIPFYKPNGKLIFFKKEDLINWMLKNRQDTIEELIKQHETRDERQ